MKIISSFMVVFLALCLSACGDPECITCVRTIDGSSFEACDVEDMIYTDENGNVIEFDQIKETWEPLGYECN